MSGFFSSEAVLDRTAPFQVCVRRVSDPGHLSEYTLVGYDSDSAALGPVGPAVVSVLYDHSRLPRSIDLTSLPAPGTYILRIAADDGETPAASGQRAFPWSGESVLYINRPPRP